MSVVSLLTGALPGIRGSPGSGQSRITSPNTACSGLGSEEEEQFPIYIARRD